MGVWADGILLIAPEGIEIWDDIQKYVGLQNS